MDTFVSMLASFMKLSLGTYRYPRLLCPMRAMRHLSHLFPSTCTHRGTKESLSSGLWSISTLVPLTGIRHLDHLYSLELKGNLRHLCCLGTSAGVKKRTYIYLYISAAPSPPCPRREASGSSASTSEVQISSSISSTHLSGLASGREYT